MQLNKKSDNAAAAADSGETMVEFSALGRYEIIRQIGRGGMGIVLLGRDPKIDRLVALKVIQHKNFADSGDEAVAVKRFHLEARAAGKLSHPNIVTVFDVGEQDDASFIAMEFVEGRDLAAILKEDGKLPFQEATRVIVQVAQALSYSHDNGIIHRDVKPGNIMIDKNGQVKITDFGLARLQEADSITRAGHTVGSPLYMSPEQIQSGDIDNRSDVFSMGVVYYEALTGVRPFEGIVISDLIEKILEEEPVSATTLNPELPPRVNIILRKMMAKSPRDRYQTAGSAARDLQNLLALPDPFKSMTESDANLTTNYPGDMTPLAPFKRKVRPKPAAVKNLALAAGMGIIFGLAVLLLGGSSGAVQARDAMRRIADSFVEMLSPPKSPPPSGPPMESAPQPSAPLPPPAHDPAAAAANPARLSIRSSVEGDVFLDGALIGKTPIASVELKKGEHLVEVQAAGHTSWSRSLSVAGGETLDFEMTLEPAPGSLAVGSEPAGARVWVDGAEMGTAPMVVTGLQPGTHKVKLEMDGHIPWTGDVTLHKGKGEKISGALVQGALLRIKAPAGALVKIDGKEAGQGAVEAVVAPGTRQIEVSMPFKKTWTGAAETAAGAETEINVALEAAGYGSLKVSAGPWAEIFINGRSAGTTPKTIAKIPAGEIDVKLVNPGFEPYSARIRIEPGKQARLTHFFSGGGGAPPAR